uniref:Peptidase M14 domain-containing protein n=1 Tax=Pectinophora gossypiella TaxID=13191 RepID=A0A1E1WBL5_PECGO
MFKSIFIFCLSFYIVFAKHEEYDGYSLFGVDVDNVDQAQLVNGLENRLGVDVWSHALPGRPGQILVPKDQKQQFQETLDDAGITYHVVVKNIKESLELEDNLLSSAARSSNRSSIGLPFDSIHRYDVVDAYLVELAQRFPNVVTVASAGRSFEGRDIKYLKISTSNFQVCITELPHGATCITGGCQINQAKCPGFERA